MKPVTASKLKIMPYTEFKLVFVLFFLEFGEIIAA